MRSYFSYCNSDNHYLVEACLEWQTIHFCNNYNGIGFSFWHWCWEINWRFLESEPSQNLQVVSGSAATRWYYYFRISGISAAANMQQVRNLSFNCIWGWSGDRNVRWRELPWTGEGAAAGIWIQCKSYWYFLLRLSFWSAVGRNCGQGLLGRQRNN